MKNETTGVEEFFVTPEVNEDTEDVVLMSDTEVLEAATVIAQVTASDEKFPFYLHYDANQKEFLLSVLTAAGATIESDDVDNHILSVRMNMTQMKLVRYQDCVERVRTDEGMNTMLADEVIDEDLDAEIIPVTAEDDNDDLVNTSNIDNTAEVSSSARAMMLSEDEVMPAVAGEVAMTANNTEPRSTCCCPTNTTMETAKTIAVESFTSGYICCPGTAQWFKFTVPQTAEYTIYTTGALDTRGTLYDSNGQGIARVDDYEPCGKVNFRIIQELQANETYYVKVEVAKSGTGNYQLGVTQKTLVNKVNVTPNVIVLDVGKTYELPRKPNTYVGISGANRIDSLAVTTSPSDADEQRILWSVSGNSSGICNITSDWYNGEPYTTLTTVKEGIITLRAYDWFEHGQRGECTVYVGGARVTDINLDFTNKIMHIGDASCLQEQIVPSNALNRNVYWTSSNEAVAEVDSAGNIKAKSLGETTITVKTEDGGHTARCTILVVEGIIVEKTDGNHSRIVFPYGTVWNCINFDIINNYTLDQNELESQRFYDNVYETKVFDKETELTYYQKPFKEYTDEELKIIYMIDPHGMAAYVREYAEDGYDPNGNGKTPLSEAIAYKDRIFKMLFNRDPDYYKRGSNGQWHTTSSRSNLHMLMSESESLFGTHPIYDYVTLREFLTVILDLISVAIQCPALKRFKFVENTLPQILKYLSLARSVRTSILSADFDGFLSAIIDGIIDEDMLDETIVLPHTQFKAANYTMGWAFELLSLSSDFGALADTFNAGPHFYKEVFTQCAIDTEYSVYLRVADGNLVSISDLANILD